MASNSDTRPLAEYAKSLTELADIWGTCEQSLIEWRRAGLVLPVKTRRGYNVAEFKRRAKEWHDNRAKGKPPADARERKLLLECDRLIVNIKIDDERLKQAEIETLSRKAEVMPVSEFRRALDDVRSVLIGGLDQLIETTSTKLRSAKVRAVLESEARGLRERLSQRAADAGK